MKTWKPVRFDQRLNTLDDQSLEEFWRKELEELTTETEKICILVPLKINKKEAKEEKKEDVQTSNTDGGKNEKNESEKKEMIV